MHLTITKFEVDPDLTVADLVRMFEQSTERYTRVPGLLAKHYYLGPGRQAGGVYLWEDEERAKAAQGVEFVEAIRQRFGSVPEVQAMYCPLSLDNVRRCVRTA
ncbi:YdhR family protein [Candidimonas humi]|uniref:YdhR family protein n=1 Tax=Candidimonas humi TaxID=683355 RepID=A0ABV8NZM1_9BURK|nr:YdhR family protein [Candidimonas humi]MBV6304062.1 YdhR family protein [Candidimonas humi]